MFELFVLMVVDLTLTRERALEEIGELLTHDNSLIRPLYKKYPGIEQTLVEGVVDTTFTLSEESEIMQRMKVWRKAQIAHGFSSEEAIEKYEHFSSVFAIGIFSNSAFWEEEKSWNRMQLFYESDHFINAANVHYETLFNALEHGSKFGARGSVTARFRGGTNGALIEVTDPGKGRIAAPLRIEQMVDILARSGRRFKEYPSSNGDFCYPQFTSDSSMRPMDRGMGAINVTVGKPVVSESFTDEGYTVLLLYKPTLMPEHWKQELLKERHHLTEENKRLLRE